MSIFNLIDDCLVVTAVVEFLSKYEQHKGEECEKLLDEINKYLLASLDSSLWPLYDPSFNQELPLLLCQLLLLL